MDKLRMVGTEGARTMGDAESVVENCEYLAAVVADCSIQYESMVDACRGQGIEVKTPVPAFNVSDLGNGRYNTIFVVKFQQDESVAGAKQRLRTAAQSVIRDGIIYMVAIGDPEGETIDDPTGMLLETERTVQSVTSFWKWGLIAGLVVFGYAFYKGWL